MGAYLSTPVTDKESEGGGDVRYSYGVCAMQGWRTDMEDAHIVNLDVDDTKKGQVALFGVFDGHGGKEVAKFCAKHIAEALMATDEYKQGNYGEALRRTYLDMDVIMTREEHMAELEAYRKGSDDEDGAPDGSLKKVWFMRERRGPLARSHWHSHSHSHAHSLTRGRQSDHANTHQGEMMLDSAQLPEAFLEAFGITRDSGYVFKVVKSADGQLNVQNVLDSEGNELGGGDDDMDDEEGGADAGTKNNAADPLDAVDDAVEHHTPLQLEEMNSEDEAWTGPQAGCTAVCAMVLGNQLVVANAGDSRCVLSRSGKAIALTEDHKPTNDEEFDRICKAGGFVADGRVNGSLNLSRALGDLDYKSVSALPPEAQMVTANPEIRSIELTPDDEFLILACDGIWDVLTNQEAVEFVRNRLLQGMAPKEVCEAACDFCLAEDTSGCGKGCDNMSIVVAMLKDTKFGKGIDGAK